MNDKLQESLAEIINSATIGVKEGVNFLSAELPEVVHQLLMWKLVESALMCLLGVFILVVSFAALIVFTGRGVQLEHSGYNGQLYEPSLTHNRHGEIDERIIALAVPAIVLPLITMATINLTWLKIWIAPKVYLIEYAASLVK